MTTQVRLNPPFRAEHIGSLLRPRELKEAFSRLAEIGEAKYREILERCIVDAIRMQEGAGLQSITDGEFRRVAWSMGFVSALEGFEYKQSLFEFHDGAGNSQRWDTCRAISKMRRPRGITTDEFAFIRAHTNRTPKVTIPAPSFVHFFRLDDCADKSAYPDIEKFWDDLVGIYQQELAALASLGATYVQLDEVPIAMLCDDEVRAKVRAHGSDSDALVSKYVEVVNRVLERRPPAMTIGMHLCRGNLRGRWMASGSYEAIAERLFNTASVDGFFLEYDSPRAGDFSPLRFMPKDKFVRLGLVSSKTPTLEDESALRTRIDEAASYAPIENLGISPQCGFASTVGGNPLSAEDEKAKLHLVVQTAERVWG